MIENNATLAALCGAAGQCDAVALDTEFSRVRSYYPKLGLIQLAYADQTALIDPLAISDWSAFIQLLRQPSVEKILHGGGEDLEIFQHYFATQPAPFWDTQILAAFVGQGLSMGLAALVAHYYGVTLDKSETRTDWLARPLSRRQCDYASADAAWLLPVSGKLLSQVKDMGWLAAARDECQMMQVRRAESLLPQDAWRDIGNYHGLLPRQFACLQLLAAWRLREARQRDLALNFVLRAEHLWQVARYLPASMAALAGLDLSASEIRCHSKALLALVKQAQALPPDVLPVPPVNLQRVEGFNELLMQIKALVSQITSQQGLTAGLLASRRQIVQVIHWHWRRAASTPLPDLLSGWRGELLAQPLSELLASYPCPPALLAEQAGQVKS